MKKTTISLRKETAKDFLPAQFHKNPVIDLGDLAEMAKAAIESSDQSLAAAQAIADGGWITRFLNSGEMQRHVIQSISHIRDISKVNLGLSAICNDLAAANLEHASRIDKNHHATNHQLSQVEKMTGELLTHLRRPREPGLLEKLLPALSAANPADLDEVHGWLRTLTEEIDCQYTDVQKKLDELGRQNTTSIAWVVGLGAELQKIGGSLSDQKDDLIRQLGLLSSRLTAGLYEAGQRTDATDAMVRKSHEILAAGVTKLGQQIAQHQTDTQAAYQTERAARDAMQQALIGLIKQREGAIRSTIGELNQHLLKRMFWVASGIVVLQIMGFAFFALKTGFMPAIH